jgi:hypothetical protein
MFHRSAYRGSGKTFKSAMRESFSVGRAAAVLVGIIAIATVIFVAPARANITPTTHFTLSDTRPGAHGDLSLGASLTYDDVNDDLKRLVFDTPAGFVGNPNAVPFAERCLEETFMTSTCPPSSQVGIVTLGVTAGAVPMDIHGTISVIQTTPEVPTILGVYVSPDVGVDVRSHVRVEPWTNGDFRLRSEVLDDFPRETGGVPSLPIQINSVTQTLWGVLPNGNAFLTNPPRCDTWTSFIYANSFSGNTNADADPTESGANDYKASSGVDIAPNCSADLPTFPMSATTDFSTGKRGVSPDMTVTVSEPGVDGPGLGSAIPRKVVTVLPASVNVDILQLGRVCTVAQRNAAACPANTKVGTVSIETPLIQAGLKGDIHLATSSTGLLPDLAIFVRGAINFRVDATNKYVNIAQLQSTFDNIPQVGFSKFAVKIDGGPNGLLRILECPEGSSAPKDGPVTHQMASYLGQTAAITNVTKFDDCVGVRLKRYGCVRNRILKLNPSYRARSNVKRSVLYVDGKKVKTSKRSPFRFKLNVKKYKRGKHRLAIKAYYKSGKVVTKRSSFRRC